MRRHVASSPCPVCGGHDGLTRGQGRRCAGFTSDDGAWAHCTREDRAGRLRPTNCEPPTYAHHLHGECGCGRHHGDASPERSASAPLSPPVAEYIYRDETGRPHIRVTRHASADGKLFRQWHPSGSGWGRGRNGRSPILYRLPEVLAADPSAEVMVTEGEKDADLLARRGFVATTNPGGARKWRSDYNGALRGRSVVILPDNDEPGRQHAEQVARSLSGVARNVRIVHLPGVRHKGDIGDWLGDGHTDDELRALINAAPEWQPQTTGAASRARFLSAAELLEMADEDAPYLVDGILIAGGTSGVVAKSKVGKSTFVMDLAMSVAQGAPFLGREVAQGTVLCAFLEEKADELRRHLRARGLLPHDPLYVHAGAAPEDAMAWLRQSVVVHAPSLIIVDTWHRLTRVRDVNDYGTVNLAMEPLVNLARESGAHLLWTHHAGKADRGDGDAVLGSTALFGSVDTLIELRRSGDRRTVRTMQRYGDDLPESVLRMDPGTYRLTLDGTRQEADERSVGAEIVAWLREQSEPVEREVIEGAVEGRTSLKRAALKRLTESGSVTRIGDGKRGSPYLFTAADTDQLSCFLVPTTTGEQENKHAESGDYPQPEAKVACSRDGADGPQLARQNGALQEQENTCPGECDWANAGDGSRHCLRCGDVVSLVA